MYSIHQPYFLVCESPLHVGVGSDPSDYIDNRIQREKHTEYPKVEGSAIKGALREYFEHTKDAHFKIAFGNQPEDTDQQKGAINISELKTLLFPVASAKGTFVWVTCPQALQTWALIWNNMGVQIQIANIPSLTGDKVAIPQGASNTTIIPEEKVKVSLVNHDFKNIISLDTTINTKPLAEWLGENIFNNDFRKNQIKDKLAMVSDDVFKYLVKYQTDVVTGNRIDAKTGIVVDGALFTTEYLPDWTVLYGTVNFANEFAKDKTLIKAEDIKAFFNEGLSKISGLFQLGGKASTGKGIVRMMTYNPLTPSSDEE